MKTQKLFLTSAGGQAPLFRITIFSFAALLCLYFVSVQTAFAQAEREVSVQVGKIRSNRLKREIYANSVNVNVSNRSVAQAWFDADSNRFRIQGLNEGTARIIFTGNYRRIIVGNTLEERPVKFRHVIQVRVLPRFEEADSRTLRLQVYEGRNKVWKIEYLLGPQFANRSEEGVRWRNVRLIDGDNRIADGLYDNGLLKFRLTGVNSGRTTIVLQGERLNNRVWQAVIRRLEVTVGS